MERITPYRTYWLVWVVLLALTLSMIAAESAPLSRVVVVAFVLLAMVLKVTMIGAWYMHLRLERAALVLSVVLGTFVTAAALFFLLVPDAILMPQARP